MSSTEPQVDKLLTPKSKDRTPTTPKHEQYVNVVNGYHLLSSPDQQELRAYMKYLQERRLQKTTNFSERLFKEDGSSLLGILGDNGYGDSYDDTTTNDGLISETRLAELKDLSDESNDDKKAETDDDTNSEKTATHHDSDIDSESDIDDTPPTPKKKKEPKAKNKRMIESQVGAGLRAHVTQVLATEGIPEGSTREDTAFRRGTTTLDVKTLKRTQNDRKQQQQRYEGTFFVRFTYTAPVKKVKDKDKENTKPTHSSSELK